MRLAIPILILAVILVLGWRVCSGGEQNHLRLTEDDLPAELREGYSQSVDRGDKTQVNGDTAAGDAPALDAAAVGVTTDAPPEAADAAAAPAPGQQAAGSAARTATEMAAAETAPQSLAAPDIDAPSLPGVSAPKADTASEGQVYVVKRGDWLMQIARDHYGDPARAKDIARANGLSDADRLSPGQELILP